MTVTYHDMFAVEVHVGDHGFEGVEELHAPGYVQGKAQRLVLIHYNPCKNTFI